jgi:hypothetical protein
MRSRKVRAAAPTATPKLNCKANLSKQGDVLLSINNLRFTLGLFLLRLQDISIEPNEKVVGWSLFEQLLIDYLDQKRRGENGYNWMSFDKKAT